MAAQWMPECGERILDALRNMHMATGVERRVVLLALATWAWKGDKAAHEEFMQYLEKFFTPRLVERLHLLRLDLEPYAEGDDHVAMLMAAALTMCEVKLNNGTRSCHW